MLAKLLFPAVFLFSIPIAYVFGGEPARISWASLLVLVPVVRLLESRHSIHPAGKRHEHQPAPS
jgi:hypothetical protein